MSLAFSEFLGEWQNKKMLYLLTMLFPFPNILHHTPLCNLLLTVKFISCGESKWL